jgi:hypothetical protein
MYKPFRESGVALTEISETVHSGLRQAAKYEMDSTYFLRIPPSESGSLNRSAYDTYLV